MPVFGRAKFIQLSEDETLDDVSDDDTQIADMIVDHRGMFLKNRLLPPSVQVPAIETDVAELRRKIENFVRLLSADGVVMAARETPLSATEFFDKSVTSRIFSVMTDGARWRALLSSDRIRVMGSAGFNFVAGEPAKGTWERTRQHMHLGVELWNKHEASHPSVEYPQDQCRRLLTTYVDEIMKDHANATSGDEA